MNTYYLNSYRINALLFVIGLLLLALAGPQRFANLLEELNHRAGALTGAQPTVLAAEPPATLLLQADALVLPIANGAAQVTARVRDAKGQPVAGVTVQFQSQLGNVAPASTTTDANGAALTTFHAAGVAGHAQITAAVNGLSREAAIQLVNPTSNAGNNVLNLDFGVNQLDPGQSATLSAVLRNAAGQPVAGELVTLFGSLGEVTPTSAVTDAAGRISATYHAGPSAGSAMITALAGVAAKSATFQVGKPDQPDQLSNKAYLPLVSR